MLNDDSSALAIILVIAGVLAIIFGLLALVSTLFMFLWNFIAAHFGIPLVNFWVSVAIVFFLSLIGSLLFKK